MTTTPTGGGCPIAQGFDLIDDDAYYENPAAYFASVREEHPVFFYPFLNAWIVTKREDVELVLGDWQEFSSGANSALIDVPERHRAAMPAELISQMLVGSDPPSHTAHRGVAQPGFTKARMEALEPEIEARAHRIIDGFEDRGSGNLVEDYCLELTTRTLLTHMGLGEEHDAMMRQLRDDNARVLSSAQEPIPEDIADEVWDRYVEANRTLRRIIADRRANPREDLISDMACATDKDGERVLSPAQIALHLSEFAQAGADTTAQAMANAVLFLADNPRALGEAIDDPQLWPRVFEETIRLRPSSTFASRRAERDLVLSGAHINKGDMIWVALASANTDPAWTGRPFEFDIHRADPEAHLAFTRGRHTCLGQNLARVQGAAGLKVLFQRLPSLRPTPEVPLDFLRMALLPVRRTLPVVWNTTDAERAGDRQSLDMTLTVAQRETKADGVISLVLTHPDGAELPNWSPGAHIDVHTGPDGTGRTCQYSLCSVPGTADRWRIGVLREPHSRGGSTFLHDQVREGSQLTVSRPRNNFRLQPSPRYLFIAGGIGITPILAMIERAEAAGADWSLLYGGRTRASMAFAAELAEYGDAVTFRPEDEYGLLELAEPLSQPREDTLVYGCGPEPLLQAVEAAMTTWPVGSLRTERFAPKTMPPTEPDEEFEVEFARSGSTGTVPAGESILATAEANGIMAPFSCREGTCGTCETRVLAGTADHRDSILTPAEQDAGETMMICVSRAANGCTKLELEL